MKPYHLDVCYRLLSSRSHQMHSEVPGHLMGLPDAVHVAGQ